MSFLGDNMIHQYKLGGYNIVLDVCSCSVHVVDDVAYDVISVKASIRDELFPTKTFPGLLTCPYTKTENSWLEAIFNLTFMFLYF